MPPKFVNNPGQRTYLPLLRQVRTCRMSQIYCFVCVVSVYLSLNEGNVKNKNSRRDRYNIHYRFLLAHFEFCCIRIAIKNVNASELLQNLTCPMLGGRGGRLTSSTGSTLSIGRNGSALKIFGGRSRTRSRDRNPIEPSLLLSKAFYRSDRFTGIIENSRRFGSRGGRKVECPLFLPQLTFYAMYKEAIAGGASFFSSAGKSLNEILDPQLQAVYNSSYILLIWQCGT